MPAPVRRRRRVAPPPNQHGAAYRRLWRVVEAAVADAFDKHPDYLAQSGRQGNSAIRSVTKRVVGAVHGYAVEAAKRRSGVSAPAPDKPAG